MTHTFLLKTIRKDFQIKFHAALLTHPKLTQVKLANKYLIKCNHSPNIINEVPKAISKRLTSISCNKNVFDRNIGIYNSALKNSSFDQTLTYDEQDEPTRDSVNEESKQTRKHKRNIICTTHHIL